MHQGNISNITSITQVQYTIGSEKARNLSVKKHNTLRSEIWSAGKHYGLEDGKRESLIFTTVSIEPRL